MPCRSNNATAPGPAVAPGAELIDAAAAARRVAVDPRLPALVPGFDAPFFQAGLAGYSDAAMRIIARRHGCPYCVTEALLDRTLLAGGRGFAKADLGELEDNIPGGAEDQPLAGQIMGSDPGEMADAAVKMIAQPRRAALRARVGAAATGEDSRIELRFAAIDVNLACPVKKIKAKARGGHWLREPDGAIEILRAVRRALPEDVPTTVKLRRGSDDSPEAERNFFRIYDAAHDLGYAWATVHGRTVEQKYVGPSRWTFLRDLVRRNPGRIVFGSGDVWDAGDIFRMIEYTGVRAVAVARGCIGNPWIFRQARAMMAGRPPSPPALDEQRRVLMEHFELSAAVNGERRASMLMRKFAVRFAAHHPRADEARVAFIRAEGRAEWLGLIERLYGPRGPDGATEPSDADAAGAPMPVG